MIETYYLNFEKIFYTGFIIGMLSLEFILFIFLTYLTIIRFNHLKDFVIKNKLWQKYEEEKLKEKEYKRLCKRLF